MMHKVRRSVLAALGAVLVAAPWAPATQAQPVSVPARTAGTPFLPGSIVALKVGGWSINTPNQGLIDNVSRADGGRNLLTDTASVVFLQEYAMTGPTAGSRRLDPIVMPFVASTSGNRALTMSSNSGSEGALRLSADGRFLTMAGYNQSQPNALIPASAPTNANDPATGQGAKFAPSVVNRTLGRVDALGNINTTTALIDAYNGDNIRSAVSSNGQQFWTSGNIVNNNANGTGGVRSAALGGSTSVQVEGSAAPGLTTSNINRVDIYNGQLYAATRNAANNGIWAIGSGTPTTPVTGTRLFDYNALVGAATGRTPGAANSSTNFQGPYDFFFSNDNTVYVADAILGISKFTKNQSSVWQYGYTFARTGGVQNDGTNGNPKQAGGTTGLAGQVLSDGRVVLFGTGGFGGTPVNGVLDSYGGNYLFSLLDLGADSDINILDIAAANEHFKGVALAPQDAVVAVVPVPPAMVLMLGGLGLLGRLGWRRRGTNLAA